MKKRDFLTLSDLTLTEHRQLRDRAKALKTLRVQRERVETLRGRSLGLFFEKSSTRTRVSFEAAIQQLGGSAVTLPMGDSQAARGEPLEDTARVLARYLDALVFRTSSGERLRAFARAATVPVINGLSDDAHPVQLLADLLTVEEHLGDLPGRTVAFIGDCNSNMAFSWIEAAGLFGFRLRLACPKGYRPAAPGTAELFGEPQTAARGADVLVTDVWTSMGQEAENAVRRAALADYRIDAPLLAVADPRCIVLHCLPAHRGEEITTEVLEGPNSAVFDEAENRLHAQKALIELLLA